MFKVEVEVSGALGAIGDMLHKLDHFGRVDVGQQLSDWQVEDMHRHRPFTMRNRGAKKASTIVRPHSRYEVNRSRMAQRRIARRAKRKRPVKFAGELRTSSRPILRAELLVSFHERLTKAFHEKLQWKKGGK
jgi:hypothetical protein